MRKLILCMQVSLDGFVEGPDGDMSWMQPDNDEGWDDLFEMLKDVDLFLLGRVMWPEYRDYWQKALKEPGFSENEVKYAKLADKTPHIIFSQTITDPQWGNATINSGNVEEEVKRLKSQPGKNIQIVGGALLAASLLNSGLVDEYRLVVNPAIIAGGKSFFRQLTQRHGLELTDVKKLDGGLVVLQYKQLSTEDGAIETPEKRRAKNNPHS